MVNSSFKKYALSAQYKPDFGLERITELLQRLNNPEKKLKIIHVAGTNGKGSVCRFLLSVLCSAGYKTGMFSSPCLIDSCDAISVNGVSVTHSALEALLESVQVEADKMHSLPSQFELNTAAAFLHFNNENCDFCILETGMGGKLDATNAITSSVMDIFTPIDFDHAQYLGNTLSEIASVKAGIVKKGSCVISAPQEKEAEDILRRASGGNSFTVVKPPEITAVRGMHEVFDYGEIKNISCALSGEHQVINAAVAIEAALKLNIDKEHIKFGIEHAENPARFEVFDVFGKIVFDGAHNPHGMRAFVKSAERYFGSCPKTIIFTAMADKDICSMVSELKKLSGENTFYTVGVANNERAADPDTLAKIFESGGVRCKSMQSLWNALCTADKRYPVFVCGSLYLYREFKQCLKQLNTNYVT